MIGATSEWQWEEMAEWRSDRILHGWLAGRRLELNLILCFDPGIERTLGEYEQARTVGPDSKYSDRRG
jgi:hypothetical protein